MDDHTYYRKYVRVCDIPKLVIEEEIEDNDNEESSTHETLIIEDEIEDDTNERPSTSREQIIGIEQIEDDTNERPSTSREQIIDTEKSGPSNTINTQIIPRPQKKPVSVNSGNIQIIPRRNIRDINHVGRCSWEEFDENQIPNQNLGTMEAICQYCNAKHFPCETPSDGQFNNCCHKGKVPVTHIQYPNDLKVLLQSNTFKNNIRQYNNALSFASFGANIKIVSGRGPQCLRVHGQTYHCTSHLHPENEQMRKYAQLYIIDTEEALHLRQTVPANKELDPLILQQLDKIIRCINPYAACFKMLKEVEDEEMKKYANVSPSLPIVRMILRKDRNMDFRRYNLPRCNEIAAVFTDGDGEPPFARDFQVYPRNPDQPTIDLNILSCNLDPMTYVLLFPYGTPGWQVNMPMSTIGGGKRQCISMLQYKVSLTAIRDEFNPILRAGKLTQQWIIDLYLQVEANNLNYIRHHQRELKSESYKNLRDYTQNDSNNTDIGKTIILPSSFQGSSRNMREKYLDAMAIVAKYGPPDLFITFTCNPKWVEITNNLQTGEKAADRPDIVARVFNQKLKSFLHDILKNNVFGIVEAYVYTIEFQKRGLPHCHMLCILRNDFKINNDTIDNIISAEIPDRQQFPRLFNIVTRNMLHGPCGPDNPFAPCMEENVCTKQFPKLFAENTVIDTGSYPRYRRRNDGVVININGHYFDNRHVVPFNKFMSLKYDAHINVEFCGSVSSVKYIYKYVYKGHDRATIEVRVDQNDRDETCQDEISQYMDARYISGPEAMWRLLENKMHDISHTIIRLAVHLPDEQVVTFTTGHEEDAVARVAHNDTTLLAWFKLNMRDPDANIYLYTDLPNHYVFKNGAWQRRQRFVKPVISRMYSVHPRDSERFYLRTLLLQTRGAKSFEDVRTYNNVLYNSFKEAAMAQGLINDDSIWDKCFEEASLWQMPSELRHMLCYIIVFCNPQNLLELWEKYKIKLAEDYLRQYEQTIAFERTLYDINMVLSDHSMSCVQVGLPPAPENFEEICSVDDINVEADNIELLINKLNSNQSNAFNKIFNALLGETENNCFFIDGPGGSGKTFLYNVIIKAAHVHGYTTIATATTGIAATLLQAGQTVHRAFKLPVPLLDTSTSHIKLQSVEAKRLKCTKLIIIDECTMLHKYAYHCIHDLLCTIMKNQKPFGGKIVVIGGDFRQTLPVIPRGTRTDIVEACIKRSHLWAAFETLSLVENMRSGQDTEFSKWLLKVGDGNISDYSELSTNYIEIPPEIICEEDVIRKIYGNNIHVNTVSHLASNIILTLTNETALALNNKVLQLISNEERIYHSSDTILPENPDDVVNYPVEFLNSITASGLPPHELKLKIGSVIILLRNLNPKNGLCNGTRLIIKALYEHCIHGEIISGSNIGKQALIPKIRLSPSLLLPFKFERIQFPVLPAFAITINKSQGQTFEKVGIYLDQPVFSHGQLYTAFSRVRHKHHLHVQIKHTSSLNAENTHYTKNVVFNEILQ